jgi:ABC-type tungstate transport system permease subunit
MLLKEMFSSAEKPTDPQDDIDWLGDLKFFMDNDDTMLNQYFFPAVKRHKEHKGNPNAYKIYVRSLERCLEAYCNKFEVTEPQDKFPKEKIIELARHIAEEQEKFIERGDYDK